MIVMLLRGLVRSVLRVGPAKCTTRRGAVAVTMARRGKICPRCHVGHVCGKADLCPQCLDRFMFPYGLPACRQAGRVGKPGKRVLLAMRDVEASAKLW